MNILNFIKRNMKNKKRVVIVASSSVLSFSSTASAAIDFTEVTSSITAAVADFTTGALILLGAYAAIWGVKKVKELFQGSQESEYDRKVREINDNPDRFRMPG